MITEPTKRVTVPQAKPVARRRVLFTIGDRIAFITGIMLTILLIGFFSWRMYGNVTRDRSLTGVPMVLPPPPAQQ